MTRAPGTRSTIPSSSRSRSLSGGIANNAGDATNDLLVGRGGGVLCTLQWNEPVTRAGKRALDDDAEQETMETELPGQSSAPLPTQR